MSSDNSVEKENKNSSFPENFTALTLPTLTSSEDGFSIIASFPRPSGENAPMNPATFTNNPFWVSFDNLPIPVIRSRRDNLKFRTSCVVATLGNITLSSLQTIDSVTLQSSDRVLVRNQNNAAQNGIYLASSTSWTRAADFNESSEIIGSFTYVTSGSLNANKTFGVQNTGNINLGITEIFFTEISNSTGFNYIIELAEPIKHDMEVKISMKFANVNDKITYAVSNDGIDEFSSLTVDVSRSRFPYQFFDPIDWVLNNYEGTLPAGNLLERRFGFPHHTFNYDKDAPIGDLYLNQSSVSLNEGMKIIHFGCYANDNSTNTFVNFLPGLFYIQDILENPIRLATNLNAGSVSTYENLGQSFNAILVQYLNGQSVKALEFGIIANIPKNYVIEVKLTASSNWSPLIYMYASSRTKEFYRYVFVSNTNLFAARIRYRGDYFYQDNLGLVSLAAKDTSSGVEAIRISHFTDFSDSRDFALSLVGNNENNPNLLNDTNATTKNEGWLAFIEGSAVYDWDFVNSGLLWTNFATITNTTESSKIFAFQDKLIVITYLTENSVQRSKVYIVNADGSLSNTNPTSIPRVTTALSTDGKFYLATFNNSQAQLWDAYAGNNIVLETPIWTRNFIEIKALAFYNNVIWIGTGYDQNLIAGTTPRYESFLYTLSGNTESIKQTFFNAEITVMNSVSTASGKLYIGLGANTLGSGQIYFTDGDTVSFWFNTNSKRVDTIQYFSEQSKIWIGCSDGKLITVSLNTDGTPNVAEILKELGSGVSYLSLDNSPKLLWIVSSLENETVLVYNYDFATFYDVYQPPNTIFVDMAFYTLNNNVVVFGLTKDNRILKINTEGFYTEERNVYLQVRDLAQNVSTAVYSDNIIFGLPINETSGNISNSEEQIVNGAIYQIRVPKIYFNLPAVLVPNTNGTQYQIVQKWTLEDQAIVYERQIGGIGYVETNIQLYPYTLNGNTGTVTFNNSQSSRNVEFFITIKAPREQNLKQIGNAFRPLGLGASYFAPEKALRNSGTYISEILNIPSITAWHKIEMKMGIPVTPNVDPSTGFESGVRIDVYVRTASTREDLLSQSWGEPFTYSTINTTSPAGTIFLNSANNNQFNLTGFTGAYLQFKLVLTTATLNISPTVDFIKIFYFTAKESKFFTKMFDTQSTTTKFRRGLLTYNGTPNGGKIQFKYLADESENNRFVLSNYSDITPNSIFTLPAEAKTIRFAILLTSVGEVNNINSKASVDEFAVQMDTGVDDRYWMR